MRRRGIGWLCGAVRPAGQTSIRRRKGVLTMRQGLDLTVHRYGRRHRMRRQAAAAEKVEKALEMDASNVDAAQLRQALRQRGSVKK